MLWEDVSSDIQVRAFEGRQAHFRRHQNPRPPPIHPVHRGHPHNQCLHQHRGCQNLLRVHRFHRLHLRLRPFHLLL